MFLRLLVVATAVAVVSVRAECPCALVDGDWICSDSSLTSIPDCVASDITGLQIWSPYMPLVRETISRFTNLKRISIGIRYPQVAKNFLEGHPYIDYFSIAGAQLPYVDNEWFMYSPRITQINLRVNMISSLASDTFSYLPLLEAVDLTYNLLTIVPPTLFQGTALTSVYLSHNFWSCDCEMANFVQWTRDNGVTIPDAPVCTNPEDLKGLRLLDLTPELGCKK